MPTHKNCFELVKEVRQGLNEYDDALAQGDDTVGAYRNDTIIEKINSTIYELYALILRRRPNEFLKEASLIAVNSVFTLPQDFGKLVLFRDDYGLKVHAIHQEERRLNASTGSKHGYYQQGRTLVLDKMGLTSTYSLIYLTKPRVIHQGKASAGGPNSLTLDAKRAPKIDDFYNGMTLENITKDGSSAITAYTAARVATIDHTAAGEDFYALVPELPEWAHHLISPKAVILLKLMPQSKEAPSKLELETYKDMLRTTLVEYTGADEDQDYEEMFTSFEPKGGGILF